MSKKRSFVPMLIRAAMLLAVALLPFALLGALALWPESKYAKLWEVAFYVYVVSGLVVRDQSLPLVPGDGRR
jgi:hypothetical protein